MTGKEFEQYATENDLVVWSKEESELIIKAILNGPCKITEINNELKDLSKKVENLEKLIKEDREEKLKKLKEDKEEQIKRLKDELEYAKFRYSWYLACNIAESEDN